MFCARRSRLSDLESEPAYVVEFSLRSGARLRYWFSSTTKLLIKIEDDARQTTTRFADYRRSRDGKHTGAASRQHQTAAARAS